MVEEETIAIYFSGSVKLINLLFWSGVEQQRRGDLEEAKNTAPALSPLPGCPEQPPGKKQWNKEKKKQEILTGSELEFVSSMILSVSILIISCTASLECSVEAKVVVSRRLPQN